MSRLIAQATMNGEKINVYASRYTENGALAVQTETEFGEPDATLSVNLDDAAMEKLEECEFYYRNYNSHPDMIRQLVQANVLEYSPKPQQKSGYATYLVAKLKVPIKVPY